MSKISNQVSGSVDEAHSTLMGAAKDITERARETAIDAAESSINFAKKYPVHTALGALGVGCLVGYLSRKK